MLFLFADPRLFGLHEFRFPEQDGRAYLLRLHADWRVGLGGHPPPPPCENALVKTTVGVGSATFGTVSYFAL